MGLVKHAMVTSPTGKGVNVLGGMIAPGEYSKAMFELSASMQWTRLDNSPTGKGEQRRILKQYLNCLN